jgi:hypothetical protein
MDINKTAEIIIGELQKDIEEAQKARLANDDNIKLLNGAIQGIQLLFQRLTQETGTTNDSSKDKQPSGSKKEKKK